MAVASMIVATIASLMGAFVCIKSRVYYMNMNMHMKGARALVLLVQYQDTSDHVCYFCSISISLACEKGNRVYSIHRDKLYKQWLELVF